MAANHAIYEHDSRGRLIKVTFPSGTIIEYSYDNAGNRTSVVTTV